MPEQLFELRRRTFDTPQFRGITFIESEAKTIINNVPGNYLPFNWTINPYRGCSHSCSYCASGDTEILMADCTHKSLEEIVPGDHVYGTSWDGQTMQLVTSLVLARWSSVRHAFRVVLADGRNLVASADHRFLTIDGWKHVATAPSLGCSRLVPDDRLVTSAAASMSPAQGFATGYGAVQTVERVDVQPLVTVAVVAIEDLGIEMPMYDITTGTGDFIANGVVSHNCFARSTHTYMDMNAGTDFETKIVVKVNAGQLLRKELRARKWKGESIAMGTATDPYQRAEGKYKLMPPIVQTLTDYRNPFSILTKGTLILRDLELLQAAAEVTDVTTAFSIATLDEDAWRKSEPGTPHPRKRIEAVAKLNGAGIPCGVLVAPILPGITDRPEQMRAVIEACVDAGATHVSPILLHLRPKVKEVYMEWLGETYPDLVPRYEDMYRKSAYASSKDKNELSSKFHAILDSIGGVKPRVPREKIPRWRAELRRSKAQLGTEQLKLL